MSKKPRGRKIRAGQHSTSGPTGGKRHSKFRAWRYSDGKTAPVTVRKIEEDRRETGEA